jgi:hypothetical protein
MNSHVQIHIHEFICSMNSSNTNIFPPLSIKVISMGTTGQGRHCNAGKCQRCINRTFEGQLGNNASVTPATRTIASAMRARTLAQRQKNCHHCLGQTIKSQIAVDQRWLQDKATGDEDERNNVASPATCGDCIMTGQTLVFDAGSSAGVTRATTPAR